MRAFLHNLFSNEARPAYLNSLQGRIFQSDGALMWFQMLDKRPLEEWTAEDVARMRPKVNELIARGQQGSVFCKTHNALMTVHGHPTINLGVTSGAVYIVRNPLDVASSFADFMGVDLDKAIDLMATDNLESPHDPEANNIQSRVGEAGRSMSRAGPAGPIPASMSCATRTCLSIPRKVFGGAARFLGLKPSRQRLTRAMRNSSFKAMRSQEERHGFNERPKHQERFFRRGTAGQWKEELTREQVERICSAHRVQMERFGYLPKGM